MTYKKATCDVCGVEFQPNSGRQKRCGHKCSRRAESSRAVELEAMKGDSHVAAKRAYRREWYRANKDAVIRKNKEYRNARTERQRVYYAKYRQENKQRLSLNHCKWRSENSEKLARHRIATKNKPDYLDKKRAYYRRRELTDPVFRLYRRVRSRVHMAIKKQSVQKLTRTAMIVGMSGDDFMRYLLQHQNNSHGRFTADNYGKKWVVDHIRPIASFNLADEAQLRQAFHYSNCQPMTPEENLIKANTYQGMAWSRGVAVRISASGKVRKS